MAEASQVSQMPDGNLTEREKENYSLAFFRRPAAVGGLSLSCSGEEFWGFGKEVAKGVGAFCKCQAEKMRAPSPATTATATTSSFLQVW